MSWHWASANNWLHTRCIGFGLCSKSRSSVGILIALMLGLFLPTTASALDSNQVNSILRGGSSNASSSSQDSGTSPGKAAVSQMGQSMTAVVLTFKGGEYDGHGSGVFIGNGLFLTNHHVVVGCDGFRVVLHDGRQLDAKVVAVGSAESTLDLAVLQVGQVDGISVASLIDKFELLDEVYSFGFPSLALKGSAKWDALMNGDQSVRPDVVASAGVIQQAQRNDKNVDVLIHSAIIRGGNSGGALVDKCGRLVGVNTWTRGDKAEIKTSDGADITIGEGTEKVGVYALVESGYNIAISTKEVMRFLAERNIPYQTSSGACR